MKPELAGRRERAAVARDLGAEDFHAVTLRRRQRGQRLDRGDLRRRDARAREVHELEAAGEADREQRAQVVVEAAADAGVDAMHGDRAGVPGDGAVEAAEAGPAE